MSANYYDPERAPDAAEWFALDEAERLRVVRNYHVSARIKTRDVKLHAWDHVIIENQLAMGFGPSRRAIQRLQAEGLTRHEAIHAMAAVVVKCLQENPYGANAVSAKVMQTRMNAELEALSAGLKRE